MTADEITPYAEALHATKRAAQRAGLLKELAHRIGTYRGWTSSPETWYATVCHQLNERHAFQWSLRDHLIAVELLGYDPADIASFGSKRAA